jgi:outer membrane protein assembly factor BamB
MNFASIAVRKSCCFSLLVLAFSPALQAAVPHGRLAPGDVVANEYSLVRIIDGQPDSADLIAGPGIDLSSFSVYECNTPGSFAFDANGDVIAFDQYYHSLVRIDLETSAWQILSGGSGFSVGLGPPLPVRIQDLVVEPRGSLLFVTPSSPPQVWRVDATTGDRSVFLTGSDPPVYTTQFPEFWPQRLAVRPSGQIVVYSSYQQGAIGKGKLFHVDPETAVRTPLSLDPAIPASHQIDLAPNEDVLLSGMDPMLAVSDTGVLRVVSGDGVGAGPSLDSVWAGSAAVTADGAIYATRPVSDANDDVIAIDPSSGDRTLLPGQVGEQVYSGINDLDAAPDGSLLGLGCRNFLQRIDPATGERSVAFDPAVGTSPYSLLMTADRRGRLLFGYNGRVERFDPATGVQSVLSSSTVGSGLALTNVTSIDVGPAGEIVVVPGACRTKILRIDANTGDRSVVSENVGAAPYWTCPLDVVWGADGFLYVNDLDALVRVDPATGVRSAFSDATHGTGPLWSDITDLDAGPNEDLWVADGESHAVFRIDLATGDRTIAADHGMEYMGYGPTAVRAVPDGSLRVVDSITQSTLDTNHLLEVDPATGDVSVVATGRYFSIEVVPEPADVAGCVAGALALFALRAIRSTRRTAPLDHAHRSHRNVGGERGRSSQ